LVSNLVGHLVPDYHTAGGFGEFFSFGFLMLTVVAVYEKNIPKVGSGIGIGAALAAGLLTTKSILNPAVAIAIAIWTIELSGIVFTTLFKLFSLKD